MEKYKSSGKLITAIYAGILAIGLVSTANAAYESRLDGNAYYDTELNLLWTTDANINGTDDWSSQMAWASDLTINGVSNWRLPTQDEAVNFFDEGISVSSPGPFINIQTDSYWTSTESNFFPDFALNFDLVGFSSQLTPKDTALFAWAVHSGDVSPIPEPSTYAMLLAGLSLLGLARRKNLINLLRAPCTYPRGKTAGYYGAENRKRRATLTSKTQTIMLPVARPRGIAS